MPCIVISCHYLPVSGFLVGKDTDLVEDAKYHAIGDASFLADPVKLASGGSAGSLYFLCFLAFPFNICCYLFV